MEIPNKIWAVRDGRFIDYSLTVDDEAYINVNYLINLLTARIIETEERIKTTRRMKKLNKDIAFERISDIDIFKNKAILKELKYIITQL